MGLWMDITLAWLHEVTLYIKTLLPTGRSVFMYSLLQHEQAVLAIKELVPLYRCDAKNKGKRPLLVPLHNS